MQSQPADNHFLEKGKYDPSIHLAHRIATIFHQRIEDVFLFAEGEDEA